MVSLASLLAAAQVYSFKTYSQSDGLSSYNPDKVVQDAFGFLWIGTQEGLNRFDGRNFIAIKKSPTGLSENFVTDCKTDAAGNIWVATSFGGVDVLNPSNFLITERHSKAKTGLLSNWVRSLCWATPDKLWIGTYTGIALYDKKSRTYDSVTNNPFSSEKLSVTSLCNDRRQNLVAGIENEGVIVYRATDAKPLATFTKAQLGFHKNQPWKLFSVFVKNTDSLFLCTSEGVRLLRWNGNKYLAESTPPQIFAALENKEVRCLARRGAALFFAGTNQGIYVTDENGRHPQWVQSEPLRSGSLLDNSVKNFFTDRFGNFWVVTKKGLNRLEQRPYAFVAFNRDAASNKALEHVNTLYPHNDSLLFVSAAAGLYLTNTKTGALQQIFSAERYGFVWDVFRLRENNYLLSAEKELLFLDTKTRPFTVRSAVTEVPDLAPIRYNYFNAMVPVGDSLLLFGSEEEKGLFIWQRKQGRVRQYVHHDKDPSGMYADHVQNIRTDRRGRVWIVSDECLSLFNPHNKTFRHYVAQPGKKGKLNSYFLFDLYDSGRQLWLTSYGGGINRFDPEKEEFSAITERDGLSSNCTYGLLPESDSVLWVSSNNGLNRINTFTGRVEPYYQSDGLQSSAFDTKSACRTGDALFFGGVDGFTKITRAGDAEPSMAFPVYLSGAEYYEGKNARRISGLVPAALTFGPTVNFLSFTVSALGFANADKYDYQYRVEGLSKDWVNLGNRNYLTLAGLSAGDYRLQVRARANRGGWNESAWVSLRIEPFWYQTWWFKAMVAVFVIGLVMAFYRYRILQLKKQHRIRKEIASDLHDDIGSTLNAVKNFTYLAQSDPSNKSHLQKIEEFLAEATAGLRDMIWVLDNGDDTVQELLERIQKFALPAAAAAGIAVQCTVDGSDAAAKLSKTEKRNLFLIAKESVNNAIKHAHCTRIEVRVSCTKTRLLLCVADDGRGLVERNTGGNGLRNLASRAEQIGYRFALDTAAGEGTKVCVTKG